MSDPSDNVRDDIFADPEASPEEPTEQPTRTADDQGQVSSAGSSFDDPASSEGGADAVPDTPDGVPEDNIADADAQDFRRRGDDAESDRQSDSAERSGSDVAPTD